MRRGFLTSLQTGNKEGDSKGARTRQAPKASHQGPSSWGARNLPQTAPHAAEKSSKQDPKGWGRQSHIQTVAIFSCKTVAFS